MEHSNEAMAAGSGSGISAQKLSRYRSVRAKGAPVSNPPPVPAAPVEQSHDLNRAPSRYRRNRAVTNAEAPPPPVPSAPLSSPQQKNVVDPSRRAEKAAPRPVHGPEGNGPWMRDRSNTTGSHAQPSRCKRREGRTNTTTSDSTRPPTASRTYDTAREEARMILEGEFDRMQRLKKAQSQRQVDGGSGAPDMRRRPTVARETKKRENAAENETVQKESKQARAAEPKLEDQVDQKSPTVKKIRQMIIGGGGNAPPQPHKQEVAIEKNEPTKASRVPEPERPSHVVPAPVPSKLPPMMPAFDAPISAVNAGDRRVKVQCNQASITLPVTPSTTVKDLLNSASVVMSEHVDPKTAILVEAFEYLGLERPLRRYEKIRDVMNSWDTDNQHLLVIMAQSECSAPGLDVKDAATTAPPENRVQMQLSSSPGKWEKRWLTLRDDGQVTASKNESGKESSNICHLSDFDLYTPTAKQKKRLRTPKKICFAVKSQQKAAMFLEGQNFAHIFCSNQKDEADRWYKALHSWRSWYLVNILGEGQKKPPEAKVSPLDMDRRPGTAQSHETVPYQLGSFKPLLDFTDLGFSAKDEPREIKHNRQRSLEILCGSPNRPPRNQGPPPSSFSRRPLLESTEPNAAEDDERQPFTNTGLLARSASRRTQGGQASGRGVVGPRGKPLIDLSADSEFADGSLLRKLEAIKIQNGEGEPRIDREKRVEANVKVGEGI